MTWGGRTRTATAALVAVGAFLAAGTGAALFDRYWPVPPGGTMSDVGGASAALGTAHTAALVVTVVLAVVGLALAVGRASTERSPGAIGGVGAALVAAIAIGVGLVTRPLVDFEQVGLTGVTVGTGLRGWRTGLRDDVRFLIVNGSEVRPGTYAAVLAIHLAAPVLAVVAAGVATALSARAPSGSRAARS